MSDKMGKWIKAVGDAVDVRPLDSTEEMTLLDMSSMESLSEEEWEEEEEEEEEGEMIEEEFLMGEEMGEYEGEGESDMEFMAKKLLDKGGLFEMYEGEGSSLDFLGQLSEDILEKLIKILSNCSDEFLDQEANPSEWPGVTYRDILEKLKDLRDGKLQPVFDHKSYLEQLMVDWALRNDPDQVDDKIRDKIHETANILDLYLRQGADLDNLFGQIAGGQAGQPADGAGFEQGQQDDTGLAGMLDLLTEEPTEFGEDNGTDDQVVVEDPFTREEKVTFGADRIIDPSDMDLEPEVLEGGEEGAGGGLTTLKEGVEGGYSSGADSSATTGEPESSEGEWGEEDESDREGLAVGGGGAGGMEGAGGLEGDEGFGRGVGEEGADGLGKGESGEEEEYGEEEDYGEGEEEGEGGDRELTEEEKLAAAREGLELFEKSGLISKESLLGLIKGHKPPVVYEHTPGTVCCLSLKVWAHWLLEIAQNAHNWTKWISSIIRKIREYASIIRGDVALPDGKKQVLYKEEWRQFTAETEQQIIAWRQYKAHVQDLSNEIIENFHGKPVNCCPKCLQDHLIKNVVTAHETLQALAEAINCAEYWHRCLDRIVEQTSTLTGIELAESKTDLSSTSDETSMTSESSFEIIEIEEIELMPSEESLFEIIEIEVPGMSNASECDRPCARRKSIGLM